MAGNIFNMGQFSIEDKDGNPIEMTPITHFNFDPKPGDAQKVYTLPQAFSISGTLDTDLSRQLMSIMRTPPRMGLFMKDGEDKAQVEIEIEHQEIRRVDGVLSWVGRSGDYDFAMPLPEEFRQRFERRVSQIGEKGAFREITAVLNGEMLPDDWGI